MPIFTRESSSMQRTNISILTLAFFCITLASCKVTHLANIEPSLHRIDESIDNGNVAINEMIAPYKSQLDEEMNQVIGTIGMELIKTKPESTLGNWLADLLQEEVSKVVQQKVDFTIQNYGGIRIPSIPPGPINRGKVFELMPFDNLAVVVELDANHTRKFIHLMAEDGGWPISKELSYTIENGKAKKIRIDGQPVEDGRIYRVGMPDYIANGGGNADFLKDKNRIQTPYLIRDLIIKHIQDHASTPQKATLDGRIKS